MRDRLGDRLAVVTGSPLMPLPGAPVWDILRKRASSDGVYANLFNTDNPDLHMARKLWYEWGCEKLRGECGGAEDAISYVQKVCDKLNVMGSLPTPENHYG